MEWQVETAPFVSWKEQNKQTKPAISKGSNKELWAPSLPVHKEEKK